MSKRQKILASCIAVLMCSAPAFAVWSLIFTSNPSGYIVTSEFPITYTSGVSMDAVDTTSQGYSKVDNLTLSNSDGNVDFQITITPLIEDDGSDSCTPDENDYQSAVYIDGNAPFTSGDQLTASSGDTVINVESNVSRFSCPANYSTSITLTPIEA